MVIGAPISNLITIEAGNIWGKLFSAEGFLYGIKIKILIDLRRRESELISRVCIIVPVLRLNINL